MSETDGVPALLCVLEGSIAVPWGAAFQKERNRKKFFAQNIEAAHEDWINHYLWKSVASFIDTIFETGVSDKEEHPVPKRNLILHGKSDPAKWNQADCLRLFQGIDSILSLYRKRP